ARRTEARVRLRDKAAVPFRVEEARSHLAIDVALVGARDVAAEKADDYLVFAAAHASGASLLHRANPQGIEDLLSFDQRPPAALVEYDVALGDGVRGLRFVANTLELLDASGAPRLRVSSPYLVGADGGRTEAILAVAGCAVDRDPAPPWGRKLTAPGAKSCRVTVT